MRNKMIELLSENFVEFCNVQIVAGNAKISAVTIDAEKFADHLLANGVTIQTTPISYERLLHIARQMHLWIFLNCTDEQKVYDELKLTEEENVVFGYGGKLEITMPEPPKENE